MASADFSADVVRVAAMFFPLVGGLALVAIWGWFVRFVRGSFL